MDLLKNKRVAIVGGGPGGLTLAALLQKSGAGVTVYERDLNKEVRVQGATLDLHAGSGLMALEAAGLMDAFKANYRPGADKLRLMDKNAHTLLDEFESGEGDLSRPEIDRGPLRKILLEALQPGTVVWDSHVTALFQTDDTWQLHFKNGRSATADIVIAADGANSIIRPLITPIRPFYSGVTMVEGAIYDSAITTPRIHALLNGGKIFVMGDEKTFILSAKGDGSLVFYTGCKTDENWYRNSGIDFKDPASVNAWFQTEFAGWDPVWLDLVAKATSPFIPRPQYCMPLDQQWAALPNLTMLGDAAHLMPPFAGEGVNMAMQDALELSDCLTKGNFPDVHTAIAAYEKQMRNRSSAAAAETMTQTEVLHSPDAIAHLLNMFSE